MCGVPPLTSRTIDAAVESWSAAVGGMADYWGAAYREKGARPLTWRSTACAGGSSWPTGVRRNGPRAIASCAAARSPACATSRRRARPTSCPRSSCRRRPATTPASSTTAPGRARCRRSSRPGSSACYALDWIGVTQETKDATITDYLAEVARRRAGGRRRRPRQPRGRLPGRLAGRHLRGAAPRARQHAHHRRRADRLPRRAAPSSTKACRRSATTTCPSSARSSPRATACSRASSCSADSSSSSRRTRSASSCSCWPTSATPRHVERYRAFEDWFKHTQDIAGPFYLWLVEHLFRDNELIGGTLRIGDDAVDLGPHRLPREPPGRRRPTTSRRPSRSSRSPTPSPRPPSASRDARRRAAISGCSWAPRRCATTGRSSWRRCSSTRAPARTPPRPAGAPARAPRAPRAIPAP